MTDPIKDLAPRMPTRFLRNFFAEKDIPEVTWDLRDREGTAHIMPNVVVVEHIAGVGTGEAKQLEAMLRRIDFANGDVNHFLRHLAGAIINQ